MTFRACLDSYLHTFLHAQTHQGLDNFLMHYRYSWVIEKFWYQSNTLLLRHPGTKILYLRSRSRFALLVQQVKMRIFLMIYFWNFPPVVVSWDNIWSLFHAIWLNISNQFEKFIFWSCLQSLLIISDWEIIMVSFQRDFSLILIVHQQPHLFTFYVYLLWYLLIYK